MSEETKEPLEETPVTAETAETEQEKTPENQEPEKKAKKKEKKEKGITFTREQVEKMELAAKQLESVKDQFTRLTAEYDNYRNRTTEEKKKIYGDAKMDCVKELLNVMDTFERALEAPCTDENYKKGVELTFAQIQKAFEKLGVTEIAALGETFDPNLHNAIKQVDDSEYESDKVCEVFQKGYLLGDRLIRPAMVAVSV